MSEQAFKPPAPVEGPLKLLRPVLFMSYSIKYLFITIFRLVTTFQFAPFRSIEAFKDVWFANFWAFFGPGAREAAAPSVKPLLQNNAHGVCLDIGPGNGQWLYLFASAMNPSITKIYGVEPNKGLHAELRANAERAGLAGIYEIIGCGAQDLATKGGIQKGSIDTIITVQCLCSIPDPERNIRELYPLLKSGGVWLVYEHIKTKYQGHFVAHWQNFCNLAWPHCFGGCELNRPTDEWLLRAGEWKENNLGSLGAEGRYDTVPHTVGTLVKS